MFQRRGRNQGIALGVRLGTMKPGTASCDRGINAERAIPELRTGARWGIVPTGSGLRAGQRQEAVPSAVSSAPDKALS